MTSLLQQTLEELFAANRILTGEGVLDGFGHVSVRSPLKPDHYFMTRSNAGGPVDESNVVELDAHSNVVRPALSGRRSNVSFTAKSIKPGPT
ncbi:MAG TPA: hypothetical protein VMH83_03460 [Candidatus Acidoferrum sp.]|nr:hypothetical protein [Candidatus Acidoferrum sp.]